MIYEKPSVKELVVNVEVNVNSSDRTSCEGGHCVKTRYSQDF